MVQVYENKKSESIESRLTRLEEKVKRLVEAEYKHTMEIERLKQLN